MSFFTSRSTSVEGHGFGVKFIGLYGTVNRQLVLNPTIFLNQLTINVSLEKKHKLRIIDGGCFN